MICNYCGKEIKDGDNFYIYNNTVYCDECTIKIVRVTYCFENGKYVDGDEGVLEVNQFQDKDFHIKSLKNKLERNKELLSNESDDYIRFVIEQDIVKINRLIAILSEE